MVAVPPSLRFGKYVLEGLLGPGGVTETYLARLAIQVQDSADSVPGQLFALKLLRPDRVPDGTFAQVADRFLSAGRQLRDFHRPGFGKVVDISDDPAATYIVAKYLAGCDLARLIEINWAEGQGRAGLDPVLAGLLCSEIARLLHVGHSARPPFGHLGLSPRNVHVTEAGEMVILDMGVSAVLRGITEQSVDRWLFVAPELQGVDCGAASPGKRELVAADLYSLGAVLHYIVVGRPPIEASSISELAAELAGAKRPTDIPDVPGKLSAAMRTLLSFEPEDRPETAAMLVEWLAGGIDVARDRQALIAESVRVILTGAQPAPSAQVSPGATPRGPVPTVPSGAHSARLDVDGGLNGRAARRRSRVRRVLVLAGAILVAAAASAILAIRWSGRQERVAFQGSARDLGRRRNVEMPPRTPAPVPVRELAPTETAGAPHAEARDPGDLPLSRVAGHLIADTAPPGAMVWVDGILKGKTFTDIVVGEGGHRVVLVAPGHRMFRDVVDTTTGAIIRRTLATIDPPIRGNGFIDVECRTGGRFPVLVDEEETGLLCPIKMMPTSTGKHLVGIFVPSQRRTVAVETTVEVGSKPAVVKFSE